MAWTPVAGLPPQYQTSTGDLASGYYLKFYADGTTTAINMATDATGGTLLDKCQLNTLGVPINGSSDVFIPFINQDYRIALYKNATDADNDTLGNADWSPDDLPQLLTVGSAVWENFTGTPTRTGNTTFTVTGDQTSTFVAGTRLRLTDSSTLYGVVFSSVFTTLTTVTVVLDSGSLSASLTSVDISTAKVGEKPISSHAAMFNLLKTNTVNQSIFQMLSDLAISVRIFGATGDGSTDDTTAIQNCINYVATLGSGAVQVPFRRSGATMYFPSGTYKTTAEITFPSGTYTIRGTGRFKTYPQVFEVQTDCPSAIMPVHTDRNCFTSNPGNEEISIRMIDLNIVTLETGSIPTAAMGFRVGTLFNRDYTFERVCITGFTSAFDVYNVGGATGIATLKIDNCVITRNTHILRCLDAQIINMFSFTRNEAGQNTNGITLEGHAALIQNNSLEGMNNCINITKSFRGCVIKANYFETVAGDYCIYLNTVKGAEVGPNFFNNMNSDIPLLIRNGRNNIINEVDITPCCDGSFAPQLLQNLVAPRPSSGTFNQNGASVAFLWDERYRKSLEAFGITEIGGFETTNPVAFHKNIEGSVGSSYTTSGNGLLQFTKGSLSESSGTWIGACILATYDDDVDVFPRFQLRVNSGTVDGSHDGQFEEWENTSSAGTDRLKHKTVLYFGYVQATAAVTSFELFFYPYGLNPTAGKIVSYSQPMMFTGLEDGAFTPFIASQFIEEATQAPSSGTWPNGWTFKNRNPQATEYFGWTNDSGTWKGYGVVQT